VGNSLLGGGEENNLHEREIFRVLRHAVDEIRIPFVALFRERERERERERRDNSILRLSKAQRYIIKIISLMKLSRAPPGARFIRFPFFFPFFVSFRLSPAIIGRVVD